MLLQLYKTSIYVITIDDVTKTRMLISLPKNVKVIKFRKFVFQRENILHTQKINVNLSLYITADVIVFKNLKFILFPIFFLWDNINLKFCEFSLQFHLSILIY